MKTDHISWSLWLLFSLFIVYGTTIPFNIDSTTQTLTRNLDRIAWIPFVDPDGSRASIPDIVQNILLFLPFGFFGFFSVKQKAFNAILAVTSLGVLLSVIVETLQLFTLDRLTGTTDIVTNSFGSFAGAYIGAKSSNVIGFFLKQPVIRQTIQIRYVYPLLVCFILVVVGALHPFDFSLDVGSVGSKIKAIVRTPLAFDSTLRDEGVVFIRFFLFSGLGSICLREWKKSNSIIKSILISCAVGIFLEASQIIIESRMPSAQDVLVISVGSLCGGLLISRWPFVFNGKKGSFLIVIATGISAAIYSLSPFQLTLQADAMNWFPFLAYYERTTFVALSNFIESMLIYFPMGFALQYFYNSRQTYRAILVVAFLIAFPLEYSQQWVVGRYADITDVLGALAGAMAGAIACRKGWDAFRRYVAEAGKGI